MTYFLWISENDVKVSFALNMTHKHYCLDLLLTHGHFKRVFDFSVSTSRGTKLMAFLYPNPILQMKRSSWRINFYICRTRGVTFCAEIKPFVWLKAMLQKGFSNSFWCTSDTWSPFPKSVAFERKENALLFYHNWQLFFPSCYHICDQFLWTCPQENICIANWLLLLKKRLKN